MAGTVLSLIERMRDSGKSLTPALASALLAEAARVAVELGRPLSPDLLVLQDDGGLSLLPETPGRAPRPGYLPPEARDARAIPRDPRSLVWTAGALGHELMIGSPPDPVPHLGLRVNKPMRKVIERALAPDRAERFAGLAEFAHAVDELPPRLSLNQVRALLKAAAMAATPGQVTSSLAPAYVNPPAPLARPEAVPIARLPVARAAKPVPPPLPGNAQAPPLAEVPGQIQVLDAGLSEMESQFSQMAAGIGGLRAELAAQKQINQDLAARLGQVDEIVRSIEPDLEPARLVARKAAALCGQRRFEEAEKELQAALADAPNSAALHLEMGRVHFAQGDSNRGHFFVAEAEFVRAVQLAPAWALAHAMVGQCRLRQRRRRDAVESLRTALSLDALCIEAQVGMVQAQRNWPIALAGAAGGAVAALALVLALPAKAPPPPSPTAALMAKRAPLVVPFAPSHVVEPAHAPVLEAAAPAKVEVPAPAPAAAPALAAPAPAAPSAPKKRAVASVSPEKQAEASEQIQSGDKALRVGKMEEAIAAFQAALAADPSQAAAHRGMGMALVMMGREEEAKKEYQRYLRLEPKAPDADRIRRILSEK